jgi:heat shock protein HslJ
VRQLVFYSAILICASCAIKNDKTPAAAPSAATAQTDIQSASTSAPTQVQPAPNLGVLPATFSGDLPCADCSAIQYRLDLFADHTYDLLIIHRGKSGNSINQSGRWQPSGASSIVLLGGRTPINFAVESANSLRLLNQSGGPIQSTLNYTLTKDTQTPNTELTNTPWHLTRLLDMSVQHFENQRDPQIVLNSDNRVTGSDGCNRLTGSYRRVGSDLTFAQLATTRMACMNGMEQTGKFTTALGAVARYHITGRHLELFDSGDKILLRFEAVFVQ